MAWKLYCDRCEAEIEDKTEDGETVFRKQIGDAPTDNGIATVTLTIEVRINSDRTLWCMNCVREVIGVPSISS